jgi:hypothetical protein
VPPDRIIFSLSHVLLVKHVPDWFPGTGFKRRARHGKKLSTEMVNAPFDMVKQDLVRLHFAYL